MALKAAQKITENLKKRFGKTFGEDCVNYLGNTQLAKIPRLNSGCVALDDVMGGGWPLGRICEIYGGESSGKTTICYHAMAQAQKKYPDSAVGFIDSEYSFDPIYARSCGVDVKQLVISQPKSGQEALAILEGMIEEGCRLIVVDSVAAMVPKEEVEGEFGDNKVGTQARMMSQGMRKLTSVIGRSEAVVIFTNQTREKIGVQWGNPETTTGGNALKFYASIRIKLTKLGTVEEGTGDNKEKTSIRVRCEAVKNKTAAPYRRGEYIVRFGKGVDNEGIYFQLILERGLVQKSGVSMYLIEGEKVNGKAKLQAWFDEHPEVYERYKKMVDDGVVMGMPEEDVEAAEAENKDESGEV